MLEPNTTKRQAMAYRMKRLILSGRYVGKLPSERTLAEELGVSRCTVNTVLDELVVQGLLERRRGLGTFVAGNVVSPRSRRAHIGKIIHVIFHDRPHVWAGRTWAGQMLHALEQAARPQGILLACHGLVADNEDAISDLLARVHMDREAVGICLAAMWVEPSTVFRLMGTGVPFVLIEWRLPDVRVNSVMFDSFEGGRLAAEHLADLGHKRFAFVGPGYLRSPSKNDRMGGFKQGLEARGLPPPAECDIESATPNPSQVEAVRALLETARPTALFCFDDKVAAMVLMALHALGVRVPEQVSVVGFGDDSMGVAEPLDLTTVGSDLLTVGRTCIELLLDENSLSRPKHVVIPVRLIPRKTTAAPPGE